LRGLRERRASFGRLGIRTFLRGIEKKSLMLSLSKHARRLSRSACECALSRRPEALYNGAAAR
jgi:hypothetical protein